MFHLFFQFCTWFPVKKEQRKNGSAIAIQIDKNIKKSKYSAPHLKQTTMIAKTLTEGY